MTGEARLSREKRGLTGNGRVKMGVCGAWGGTYTMYNIYLHGMSLSNTTPYTMIIDNYFKIMDTFQKHQWNRKNKILVYLQFFISLMKFRNKNKDPVAFWGWRKTWKERYKCSEWKLPESLCALSLLLRSLESLWWNNTFDSILHVLSLIYSLWLLRLEPSPLMHS